jgi:hypothetical protein
VKDNLLDELLNEEPVSEADTSFFDEEDKVLEPLLDEINLIQDQAIRFFVRSVLLRVTEYHHGFWEIPASFSGRYHPPDERGIGGNVLHTKRVVRIAELLSESQDRSPTDFDVLIAAALLHDITKGVWQNGAYIYDPMHPYTVDKVVQACLREDESYTETANRSTTLYIDDDTLALILRLVRCHLGLWSPIPETYPLSALDWTLHLADHLASKLHILIDGRNYDMRRWVLDDSDPKPEIS